MKRALLQSLLAVAAAFASVHAGAQAGARPDGFPARPVRIIVPFTPGSATDIMARHVGPRLAERWGRPVVIDNRPSAGGVVACQTVAEAAPDGHTLLVTGSNFAGSAALYAGKLPYDAFKDFAPVAHAAAAVGEGAAHVVVLGADGSVVGVLASGALAQWLVRPAARSAGAGTS